MRLIETDATNWKTYNDFCDALLAAVGAPDWNGTSLQALIDSLVWDGVNKIKPPYTIQIRNTARLSKDIVNEIEYFKKALSDARAEFSRQRGKDLDVSLEITP